MRASAVGAVKQFAIDHGFDVMIKDSSKTQVTLKCAQGGVKSSHKAGGWQPEEYRRTPRTKLAGCGYEVALKKHPNEGQWSVSSWSQTHTVHRRLEWEKISALSSVRRFLNEKHSLYEKIVQRHDYGTEPRAI